MHICTFAQGVNFIWKYSFEDFEYLFLASNLTGEASCLFIRICETKALYWVFSVNQSDDPVIGMAWLILNQPINNMLSLFYRMRSRLALLWSCYHYVGECYYWEILAPESCLSDVYFSCGLIDRLQPAPGHLAMVSPRRLVITQHSHAHTCHNIKLHSVFQIFLYERKRNQSFSIYV